MGKEKSPGGLVLALSAKGIAYYLACKHGLCPKVKAGYDTTNFDRFWNEFETELAKQKERGTIDPQFEHLDLTSKKSSSFWNGFALAMGLSAIILNLLVIMLKY